MRWLTSPAYHMAAMTSDTISVLRRESRYRDVPAVEPRPGLIGEAVLDGTFSLLVNLLVGVPETQHLRRGHQELLAMREFLDRRGWLADPAGYHREPPALRAPQISGPRRSPLLRGSTYREISFESDYEPHPGEPGRERWLAHEENGTAVAHVLEHEGGDRPWLVCSHGFSMGYASVNMAGLSARWIHRELGLNVLMPVLPLHGPRSSTRFSGGGLLQPDLVSMLHVFAQAVWDVRRLVQWLRSRTDAPIGLYGISLGAYTAALTSAFIDDVACVIAGIPAVDFTSLARDNEPWAYRAYGGDLRTDWSLVQNVMVPVSPLHFEPRAPRHKRFIYAGVADRVARPDQARALWRHWQKPEIAWLPSGHVIAALKEDTRPFLRGIVREHLYGGGRASFESGREQSADAEDRVSAGPIR